NPHDRFLWTQIERDQLVRFSDANDFRDTGQVFKTPAVNGTLVTGNADSCSRGSRHWMRTKSYCLDNIDHRIDLVRRGAGFHHNQHMDYRVWGCFIDAKAGFLLERGREISVPLRNGRLLSSDLEGPDFEKGCEVDKVADGEMLVGHAFGEAILVARRRAEVFAIGATCTHYGGPLSKGLMVDCTVRCPWHHARFDLRTGEAIAAPALNNVACYKIDKRGEQFFVTGKVDEKLVRKPESSPASVVIVGAGAAGGAAAERLRRGGYHG